MSRAKDELKHWVPQRGKKIMGIPEYLGFTVVLIIVIIILIAVAR
jgi:hypothetical protein